VIERAEFNNPDWAVSLDEKRLMFSVRQTPDFSDGIPSQMLSCLSEMAGLWHEVPERIEERVGTVMSQK
jgi:hypothetical protein